MRISIFPDPEGTCPCERKRTGTRWTNSFDRLATDRFVREAYMERCQSGRMEHTANVLSL